MNNKLTDETLSAWKMEAKISLGETAKGAWDYSHHEAILALVTELQERRKADNQEPAGYHIIKECGKVGCSVATLEEAEKTRGFWNKKWIIKPYFYTAPPAPDNKQTDELVMWVKRLSHSLRNARPDSKLHGAVMDYLSRKGLISVEDVLR
ncbi:hypothetical protein DU156_07005 [Salmonella enterica subsp. enterica serovar Durham]|nr:hypothetical protein [Salmonella enterica subsp. enterica serovar Durham]